MQTASSLWYMTRRTQQLHGVGSAPYLGLRRGPSPPRAWPADGAAKPVDVASQHRTNCDTWEHQTADCSASTVVVHPRGRSSFDPYHATGPPVYQTATFGQPSATKAGEYDYTRSGNPTRSLLEAHCARLEQADRAFAFASGMAAIAALLRLCPVGSTIIAGDDLYGGSSRLLSRVAPTAGLTVVNVDTTNPETVKAACAAAVAGGGGVGLVLLESPTNPRMQVCDLAACTAAVRATSPSAVVAVDNSMAPFLYCLPLHEEIGADISMTSLTKFPGGHSDITGGVLAVRDHPDRNVLPGGHSRVSDAVAFTLNAEGAILAPHESWLALRGMRTMAVRMERQAENAARIAAFLDGHPLVKTVSYPGLPGHANHAVHVSQMGLAARMVGAATVPRQGADGLWPGSSVVRGGLGGSLLSFTTGSLEASRTIVEACRLMKITVSFGSVTSQISLPCFMSHASIPAEVRAARGLPDDLVRISAGVEDGDDLLEDLAAALRAAGAAVGRGAEVMGDSWSAKSAMVGRGGPEAAEVARLRDEVEDLRSRLADLAEGAGRGSVVRPA